MLLDTVWRQLTERQTCWRWLMDLFLSLLFVIEDVVVVGWEEKSR